MIEVRVIQFVDDKVILGSWHRAQLDGVGGEFGGFASWVLSIDVSDRAHLPNLRGVTRGLANRDSTAGDSSRADHSVDFIKIDLSSSSSLTASNSRSSCASSSSSASSSPSMSSHNRRELSSNRATSSGWTVRRTPPAGVNPISSRHPPLPTRYSTSSPNASTFFNGNSMSAVSARFRSCSIVWLAMRVQPADARNRDFALEAALSLEVLGERRVHHTHESRW